jgi:hypothetical protein
MGYLNRAAGIADSAKGVISLWFRVPAASLGFAQAQFLSTWNSSGVYDYNLNGMVPLVAFGGSGTFTESPDGDFNLGCSFIGINCGAYSKFNGSSIVDAPHLVAKLQYRTSDAIGTDPSATGSGGDGFPIGYDPPGLPVTTTIVTPLHIPVSGEAWHHVIISYDMTDGCATTSSVSGPVFNSSCKFWLAFDDSNYDSAYLWPSWNGCYTGNGGAGANDVGSAWCKYFFDAATSSTINQSFTAGALPLLGYPLGIPAAATADISHIFTVEMAELQFFTGVSLDTSVTDNRRAFIKSDGSPETDYSIVDALLGKTPEVRIHGSANWKVGTNSGTAGDFTKVGTINTFNPGPT